MKGKLILISSGEYSDYSVKGLFRWLSDVSAGECLDKYLEEFPEQKEDYRGNYYQFIAWLTNNNYAEDVECAELFLGGYSQWKMEAIPKKFVFEDWMK